MLRNIHATYSHKGRLNMNMLAYHGDATIKTAILAQLAQHRTADELVQGIYWENGRGCAVGCTIHGGEHGEYETRFGIPMMLARLEDSIFEGLPNDVAKLWPERFMSAVRPGADLSRVGWQFLHWLLTDETINPGINHELVRDAVRQCADVLAVVATGHELVESAAWSVESAARSAARSAAWSAARSAEWSAASAESAASAARSAAWSAESAARSAESTARSAAWVTMSNKLVELVEAA
jgi:hypothetical protein